MSRLLLLVLLSITLPHSAQAGMPSALPTDIQRAVHMTDSAVERFQAISFFLLTVLICSLVFRAVWNSLRKDFPKLPHLTTVRAVGLILVWGVAMIVVLTMISGARELMTPGAWERNGFTFRVLADQRPSASNLNERMERLNELRVELLHYAALNEGRYPSSLAELTNVRSDLPGVPGLKYRYLAGSTAMDAGKLLLYEPDLDRERRLALFADGEIRVCDPAELSELLSAEKPR